MKAVPIALLVVILAFGMVAGAVFGLGDEEIFVQPPESVAQEFVRAMALGQVGAARNMLSQYAEQRTTHDDLRRTSAEFRARIGRLEDVDGEVTERGRESARVRAKIIGERMRAEPVIILVRQGRAWSVTRARDVLAMGDSTSQQPLR